MADIDNDLVETVQSVSDIGDMTLDLTPEQKMRTVALMMGIRYYCDTIIKDPDYLKHMIDRERDMERRNDDNAELWHLRPANYRAVIECTVAFHDFLSGKPSGIASVEFGGETIYPGDGSRLQSEVESAAAGEAEGDAEDKTEGADD